MAKRRKNLSVFYHKKIATVQFGNKTSVIQHQSSVFSGNVRLDFCDNIIEQIVVVYFTIQKLRRISSLAGAYHFYAVVVIVNQRFPFRQNDEAGTILIESRVHSAGYFFT